MVGTDGRQAVQTLPEFLEDQQPCHVVKPSKLPSRRVVELPYLEEHTKIWRKEEQNVGSGVSEDDELDLLLSLSPSSSSMFEENASDSFSRMAYWPSAATTPYCNNITLSQVVHEIVTIGHDDTCLATKHVEERPLVDLTRHAHV